MPSPESPILIQSGPLIIQWYGFWLVCAVLVGAFVARFEAKRKGEDVTHIGNLLMWSLILGLIGARLYHVLSVPHGASRDFYYYFIEQPFANLVLFGIVVPFPTALFLWAGGLGLFGALLGGVGGIIIYTRRHGLSAWRWLDIATPAMFIGQTIGRWGNFFNQELYGTVTTLPWGITISNVNQRLTPYDDLTQYPLDTLFHPVFLYESLWTLLGFGLALFIARKYAGRLPDGGLFCLYLIWYGLGRLFIEGLRPDTWMISGVAVAQVMSIGSMLIGIVIYRRRQSSPAEIP